MENHFKSRLVSARFFLLVPLLLTQFSAVRPLNASDEKAGTSGGVFMKIPTGSPRAQALGNCGVSLVEGSEAMTINPAGMASSQMREVGFAYMSWFQDYSGQYVAYVHPVGQSVIGVNFATYGIQDFDARDEQGIPQYGEDIRVIHRYATLTVAKSFLLERLLLGASVKGVWENNYSAKYYNMVLDAGVILKPFRKLSLGMSGANHNSKEGQVVRIGRLGGALSLNPFITLVGEFKEYSDRNKGLGGGLEFNLTEEMLQVGRVSLRTGYVQGLLGIGSIDDYGKNYDDKTLDTLGLTRTGGWTFGFGIYSAQAMGFGVSLDYTMVPYGALGKASQIMIRAQF